MCPAAPPRPWIQLPFRSRCSGSRLQAPRRRRSPWLGLAGCSGRCSGAAAVTAAAVGAPAPPACPSTRPPAPSPPACRAAAACCCSLGPLQPPPPRREASTSGLRPPEGWRALPPWSPPPRPRPQPPTRPCAPLCCRSRWLRPRARRGVIARYVGAATGRAHATQRPSACAPRARPGLRALRRTPAFPSRSVLLLGTGTREASGFLPVLFSLRVWSVGQCKCGWGEC